MCPVILVVTISCYIVSIKNVCIFYASFLLAMPHLIWPGLARPDLTCFPRATWRSGHRWGRRWAYMSQGSGRDSHGSEWGVGWLVRSHLRPPPESRYNDGDRSPSHGGIGSQTQSFPPSEFHEKKVSASSNRYLSTFLDRNYYFIDTRSKEICLRITMDK